MKTKLLFAMTTFFVILGIANLINTFLNFREADIQSAVEKSKMAANIIKDGLTAHMVNGMMNHREYFLKQISSNPDIKSLWIVRGKNVSKQFGDGLLDETPRDEIDKSVLKNGKTEKKLYEDVSKMLLRITIPYIAEKKPGSANCLACHNVKEGDTLGAISMEFDISAVRTKGTVTLLKILSINLVFVVLVLFVINYYITPFTKLFLDLKDGMTKAYNGDFSHKFSTNIKGEAADLVYQINTLFEKMNRTFGDVTHSLATFSPNGNKRSGNPLDEANLIIQELSDIYKFKKTIELDMSKDVVYSRIVDIFKDKYNLKYFSIYEIDDKEKTRQVIYANIKENICAEVVDEDALECRAYRTETNVVSDEFKDLCQACIKPDANYFCFFYNINDEYSIVVSIVSDTKEELEKISIIIPHLKNYLEAAKPVIEGRLLMEKLRQTTLKDSMTGLYNRRFLEEFIDKFMSQADRSKATYHVMMIDIDYFKQVNDTYGHDMGDIVIVELAKILQKSIRNSDIAVRYGGEEFLVMLQNSTDDGAMMVAKNIHDTFSSVEFKISHSECMQKTLSIGVSKFPADAQNIWKCIKNADVALYAAKENGRNQIVVFSEELI